MKSLANRSANACGPKCFDLQSRLQFSCLLTLIWQWAGAAPGKLTAKSLLLTFPRAALRAKIGSDPGFPATDPRRRGGDEAEDEGFSHSRARRTTRYEPICATTLQAGASFPDFGGARRSSTPGNHPTDIPPAGGAPVSVAPCSLNSEKSTPGARHAKVNNRL